MAATGIVDRHGDQCRYGAEGSIPRMDLAAAQWGAGFMAEESTRVPEGLAAVRCMQEPAGIRTKLASASRKNEGIFGANDTKLIGRDGGCFPKWEDMI